MTLGPLALLLGLLTGCASLPEFAPLDLSQPGWSVQSGQAVWTPRRGAPELAGELVIASRGEEAWVQFTKTPFPILTAWKTPWGWKIEFARASRTLTGRGAAPRRWIWLHLSDVLLRGTPPPAPWIHTSAEPGRWKLYNPATGETLEGYTRHSDAAPIP